jgi:hypothetical protein
MQAWGRRAGGRRGIRPGSAEGLRRGERAFHQSPGLPQLATDSGLLGQGFDLFRRHRPPAGTRLNKVSIELTQALQRLGEEMRQRVLGH